MMMWITVRCAQFVCRNHFFLSEVNTYIGVSTCASFSLPVLALACVSWWGRSSLNFCQSFSNLGIRHNEHWEIFDGVRYFIIIIISFFSWRAYFFNYE